MTTRLFRFALAISLLAPPALTQGHALYAAAQDRVWANMNGTIKTIDEKLLVIAPSANKKGESTFELTPEVKRSGTLTVGAPVMVRFYLDNGKRVVTEITGKSSK